MHAGHYYCPPYLNVDSSVSSKPPSSDRTDRVISATLQVSNDTIRITYECCVTKWKITYRTSTGRREE